MLDVTVLSVVSWAAQHTSSSTKVNTRVHARQSSQGIISTTIAQPPQPSSPVVWR